MSVTAPPIGVGVGGGSLKWIVISHSARIVLVLSKTPTGSDSGPARTQTAESPPAAIDHRLGVIPEDAKLGAGDIVLDLETVEGEVGDAGRAGDRRCFEDELPVAGHQHPGAVARAADRLGGVGQDGAHGGCGGDGCGEHIRAFDLSAGVAQGHGRTGSGVLVTNC